MPYLESHENTKRVPFHPPGAAMLEFLDVQRQRVLINPELVAIVRAAVDDRRRNCTEVVMRDGERILLEDHYDAVKERMLPTRSPA